MMKSDYIVYALLLIVLAALAYSVVDMLGYNPLNEASVESSANTEYGFKMASTGSTDSGDVQIDLQPMGVQDGKLMVNFAINTHSVDLSQFDLAKLTTLEYDGNSIKPVSAPELQGHHASGTLEFNIGKELKKFKITITGIPNIPERLFDWSQ